MDIGIHEGLHSELTQLRQRVVELEQLLSATQPAPEALTQQQRIAIESALDGIAILDQHGTYVYMNQAHAQVHGYDQPAELLGQPWSIVVPDDLLPWYEQACMPTLWRQGHWRGEVISKRRDGSLHPTDVALTALDGGGIVCIVRDNTERNQADLELQKSQQLLRLVMDHIPQAIFWKDRDLAYLGCNQHFARDAGLTAPDDIVGKTDFDLPWAAHAEGYRADDRLVMERDISRLNFEEPIQTVNGPGWLRTSKVPLHDSTGTVVAVLGMYEDISAQKQLVAEHARLQEQIIQAQAATLAELSTPLIPINDQVMVMPLIGTMDSSRAGQVLDTILKGIAQSHVTVVIVDITGVPIVDTQVANALIRAAHAVKLLGAQVVLTGIRPEVAQTLVGLGTDLSGITTRSSLQSGIAYATSTQR
jgi:PAS domain S-box-containing protein